MNESQFRVKYSKTGEVNCVHNSTKKTFGHCKELSELDCAVGCGSSSTDDARKRCKFFKEDNIMPTEPLHKDEYCEELTGDWSQVPEWAIKRLNFLEGVIEHERRSRAPLGNDTCPKFIGEDSGISCLSIKLCLPYLCDGSCGKTNEVWADDEIIAAMNKRVVDCPSMSEVLLLRSLHNPPCAPKLEIIVYDKPSTLNEVARFSGPFADTAADAYFSAECEKKNHINADCVAINGQVMLGWDEWPDMIAKARAGII